MHRNAHVGHMKITEQKVVSISAVASIVDGLRCIYIWREPRDA